MESLRKEQSDKLAAAVGDRKAQRAAHQIRPGACRQERRDHVAVLAGVLGDPCEDALTYEPELGATTF